MDLKINNQDKFITFLQKQYEEQTNLEKYYQKCLLQLKQGKKDNVIPMQPIQSSPSPTRKDNTSPNKSRIKHKRIKTQEASSIMEESMVSIDLQGSKVQKKSIKHQAANNDMEYKLLSKEITKLIDSLCHKDITFKKTPIATPKKATTNRSSINIKQSLISLLKVQQNSSSISINKTQRQQKSLNQRQQLLTQLGDITMIVSNDQHVLRLISNARLEEERFIDALLVRTDISAMSKMKNYVQRLAEKNQEALFKYKQAVIDKSLAKLQSNKQTVKNGYTQRMKQLIEGGIKKISQNRKE